MQALSLQDIIVQDEVGYSKSEVINQEVRSSNESAIIEIKFPQSHKILDLRTAQLIFRVTKPAEALDNKCTIPEPNDIFKLEDVRFNQNRISNSYSEHIGYYNNWLKYFVSTGNKQQTSTVFRDLVDPAAFSDNENSLLGNNQIALTGTKAEIDDTKNNYLSVKLCEICPALYEMNWVSLTHGDFSVTLRVNHQQYVYGVLQSSETLGTDNNRAQQPFALSDFQIFRRYHVLKQTVGPNEPILSTPKIHLMPIHNQMALNGQYNQLRTTITNSSVYAALVMFTRQNYTGQAGKKGSEYNLHVAADNDTGQWLPFHHSYMPEVQNLYIDIGGRRYFQSDPMSAQKGKISAHHVKNGLASSGMSLSLEQYGFIHNRGFYFVPINSNMLEIDMLQQGTIATSVVEFASVTPKMVDQSQDLPNVNTMQMHVFFLCEQTLVGAQLHRSIKLSADSK